MNPQVKNIYFNYLCMSKFKRENKIYVTKHYDYVSKFFAKTLIELYNENKHE